MQVPNKVPESSDITGTELKRTLNKLIDAVKSNRINTSSQMKATRTSGGTTLEPINNPRTKGGMGGGGLEILWAKVTAVTDANNYTVSIYNRSDETTALETSKQCRVFDIVDSLVVNDWIPVQASSVTGEDYECIQQLGVLG